MFQLSNTLFNAALQVHLVQCTFLYSLRNRNSFHGVFSFLNIYKTLFVVVVVVFGCGGGGVVVVNSMFVGNLESGPFSIFEVQTFLFVIV